MGSVVAKGRSKGNPLKPLTQSRRADTAGLRRGQGRCGESVVDETDGIHVVDADHERRSYGRERYYSS